MELVLPIYNAHPYFFLKNLSQKVCILNGKIWYMPSYKVLQLGLEISHVALQSVLFTAVLHCQYDYFQSYYSEGN